MYRLFSQRMNPSLPPNVMITDEVPERVRNQLVMLIRKYLSLNGLAYLSNELQSTVLDRYHFCKGNDVYEFTYQPSIYDIIKESDDWDCLDILDIVCDVLLNNGGFLSYCGEQFRIDFNDVLLSNSMGYIIVGTQLVPNIDPGEAAEVIMPSYYTLASMGADAVSQHLDDAYNFFKERRNLEAISSAYKAVESITDLLLKKTNTRFENGDKTINKIKLLDQTLGIESIMAEDFNKLIDLMSRPGKLRNKYSGHGSSVIVDVPDHLVKYEMDLVASNILFIARSYLAWVRR